MATKARSVKRLAREVTPPVLYRMAARGVHAKERRRAPLPEDAVAEWYDDEFRRAAMWKRPYWQAPWYYIWTVVADRIVAAGDQRVLDIGCGPGQLAALLADRGITGYLGVDFSAERIAQARRTVPSFRFEVADAYTSPLFDDEDYDVAVCLEFLEHVTGDLDVLQRLRPGTRVIGTVPNFGGGSHVRHFTASDEVERRYGQVLSALRVDRFKHPDGSLQFLLDGTVGTA